MKVTAFRVFYLVLILSIWQLITSLHIVNELVIPTPLSVGESLYTFFSGTTTIPDFYTSLIVTGIELATAYVIVAIMGVLIGMAFGLFRIIWRSFNPLLFAFFSIPMVVLYPVMFLVFGLGIWSKITFGILLGILPVIVNTSAGMKQVKPEQVLVARSVGLSKLRIFTKVMLPSSSSFIVAGLRLGFMGTLGGVTLGEFLASTAGIGWLLGYAYDQLLIADAYGLFFLMIAIAWAGNSVLWIIERRSKK